MKRIALAAIGAAALSSVSCAHAIKAGHDYDKAEDVSRYHTYFMLKGTASGSDVLDQDIVADIEGALIDAGWLEVPPADAEAVVLAHVSTDAMHSEAAYFKGWGGWNWHLANSVSATPAVEDYKPGTLVVDIFDARTKQLIWRGFAADALLKGPDTHAHRPQHAVADMFKQFPFPQMPLAAGPIQMRTVPMVAQSPAIFVASSPAVLILIDGAPVYREIPGTTLQRIVNTKPFIVRDETGMHYLKISDGWMESYSIDGWWTFAGAIPKEARTALSAAVRDGQVDLLNDARLDRVSVTTGTVPGVYLSTTPAELIAIDGEPQFAPVGHSSLLYVTNTRSHMFKEPTDQEFYVRLTAGWFRAWEMTGPWEPVRSDDLPTDFATIAED
jgi:uncharacterized protein DUF4136